MDEETISGDSVAGINPAFHWNENCPQGYDVEISNGHILITEDVILESVS